MLCTTQVLGVNPVFQHGSLAWIAIAVGWLDGPLARRSVHSISYLETFHVQPDNASNLAAGVASGFSKTHYVGHAPRGQLGVFVVDERWCFGQVSNESLIASSKLSLRLRMVG